jgi:hypothetical protein
MLLALLASVAMDASRTSASVDPTAFRTTIVDVHNRERRLVGTRPLEWDEGLAQDAAAWAKRLASSGSFDHDPSNQDEGENLWMGTKGYYTVSKMLDGWIEEKIPLRRMRSWEDDYHRVGHYTQMVWKDTTAVGCAIARSRSDEVLVCRYDPAGNVMGQSPYGVGSEETSPRGGDRSRYAAEEDPQGEWIEEEDPSGPMSSDDGQVVFEETGDEG